jgi:hypothetical protein
MTNIAIEFEEEGFYVPMRRVSPSVIEPSDLLETVNQFGELRTREDWAFMIGAAVLAVAMIAFDISYAVCHWGRL